MRTHNTFLHRCVSLIPVLVLSPATAADLAQQARRSAGCDAPRGLEGQGRGEEVSR